MRDLLIGLDLGSTSFKCVACDVEGRELATASLPTPWTVAAGHTWLEPQNAKAAAMAVLSQALGGVGEHRVLSIGLTGMAEAGFRVTPDGQVAGAALAWHDPAGVEDRKELDRTVGAERFSASTGVPLTTRLSVVKASWMNRRTPVDAPLRWTGLPEWVTEMLCGVNTAELSLAARTGFFDQVASRWDEGLLSWAGVDVRRMPEPRQAGDRVGTVNASHSLLPGAVVTVAGHDHLCAAVGGGATSETTTFDSLGTGEAVFRSSRRAPTRDFLGEVVRGGCTVGPHVLTGRVAVMAGLGMGARLTKVATALLPQGMQRYELDRLALSSPSVPAPDWVRSVLDDSDKQAGSPTGACTDPGMSWRSALEHAAHRCAQAVERLDSFVGPSRGITAAGGWFRSPAFTEIRRGVLPTMQVAQVCEATGRGAALLAGVAAGVYSGVDDLPQNPEPMQEDQR